MRKQLISRVVLALAFAAALTAGVAVSASPAAAQHHVVSDDVTHDW